MSGENGIPATLLEDLDAVVSACISIATRGIEGEGARAILDVAIGERSAEDVREMLALAAAIIADVMEQGSLVADMSVSDMWAMYSAGLQLEEEESDGYE